MISTVACPAAEKRDASPKVALKLNENGLGPCNKIVAEAGFSEPPLVDAVTAPSAAAAVATLVALVVALAVTGPIVVAPAARISTSAATAVPAVAKSAASPKALLKPEENGSAPCSTTAAEAGFITVPMPSARIRPTIVDAVAVIDGKLTAAAAETGPIPATAEAGFSGKLPKTCTVVLATVPVKVILMTDQPP
jgi:hypothetical protein